MKQIIAVLFGGRSPEHDVSVVTALQVMDALDSQKYEIVPVYLSLQGEWFTGTPLRDRKTYIPDAHTKGVTSVLMELAPRQRPRLVTQKAKWFSRLREIRFDVAMPAFHGLFGEDGGVQGAFELANVPYTGMRLMACALLMDKVATKRMMRDAGIPVLPFVEVRRPTQGTYIAPGVLRTKLQELTPPYCVKPSHLGSSIGVSKANNADEVVASLSALFAYDHAAIIEPFVPNMVEYNVAVARFDGKIFTSAIEQPKRVEELLDFKQKYLSLGGKKIDGVGGQKMPGENSEGMLSLTRELNPALDPKMEANIRGWAETAFDRVDGTGVPRIDFIGNQKTGEVWLNEINPCPGSFGFFLWEASRQQPTLFSTLLDRLIEEAIQRYQNQQLPADPVPEAARLLKRRV